MTARLAAARAHQLFGSHGNFARPLPPPLWGERPPGPPRVVGARRVHRAPARFEAKGGEDRRAVKLINQAWQRPAAWETALEAAARVDGKQLRERRRETAPPKQTGNSSVAGNSSVQEPAPPEPPYPAPAADARTPGTTERRGRAGALTEREQETRRCSAGGTRPTPRSGITPDLQGWPSEEVRETSGGQGRPKRAGSKSAMSRPYVACRRNLPENWGGVERTIHQLK